MTRSERSVEIKVPPEKVWDILALDRMQEWVEGVKVEYTSEVRTPGDKYRVGATAHLSVKSEGEHDVEITESVENERMTYRSKPPYYKYTATYMLKPVEGGTELTWMSDYEMPWGILGKFLLLFFQRAGEKEYEKSLGKLKNILET